MNTSKNIYLIGFMGCGKTSVSAAMGRLYGKTVVEIDDLIIAREGRSVNAIFAESGEPYFRDCETQILTELSETQNYIVSCGGGIVLRPENIELMRKAGMIVLLDAEPQTILDRVGDDDSRPNLRGRKTVAGVQELKNKRASAYSSAADIKVDTDNKTIDEVAKEIYESVYRAG